MIDSRDFGYRREEPQNPAGLRMEFFQTVAGPDTTVYPADADPKPTVYYARRLKNVTFTKTPGVQALDYDLTDDYKHLFNLQTDKYIEEGSIVAAWEKNGRWWTIDKVTDEESVAAFVAGLEDSTGPFYPRRAGRFNEALGRDLEFTTGAILRSVSTDPVRQRVALGLTGTVRVLDYDFSSQWTTIGHLCEYAINGTLYVAADQIVEGLPLQIRAVDPAGAISSTWLLPPGGGSAPVAVAVAVDPAGDGFLLADYGDGFTRLYRFNTPVSATLPAGLKRLRSSASGILYAVNTTGLYRVGAAATLLVSHGAALNALAIDSAGDLYIAGVAGTGGYSVRKVDSSGSILWNATTSFEQTALAVSSDGRDLFSLGFNAVMNRQTIDHFDGSTGALISNTSIETHFAANPSLDACHVDGRVGSFS